MENTLVRTVKCVKLGREAEGLAHPPYPGDLGQRILENISREAWNLWLAHQTLLINEHHLSPRKAEARKFLEEEMIKFLYEGGAQLPEGYVKSRAPDERGGG